LKGTRKKKRGKNRLEIFVFFLIAIMFLNSYHAPRLKADNSRSSIYAVMVIPDEIDSGDNVKFWASIENTNTSTTIVLLEMFVFVYASPEDNFTAWNDTKSFDEFTRRIPPNMTKTDIIAGEIDLDPGTYIVVVGFRTADFIESANATLTIRTPPETGTPLLTAAIIGIVGFILVIFIIGVWGSYKEKRAEKAPKKK